MLVFPFSLVSNNTSPGKSSKCKIAIKIHRTFDSSNPHNMVYLRIYPFKSRYIKPQIHKRPSNFHFLTASKGLLVDSSQQFCIGYDGNILATLLQYLSFYKV